MSVLKLRLGPTSLPCCYLPPSIRSNRAIHCCSKPSMGNPTNLLKPWSFCSTHFDISSPNPWPPPTSSRATIERSGTTQHNRVGCAPQCMWHVLHDQWKKTGGSWPPRRSPKTYGASKAWRSTPPLSNFGGGLPTVSASFVGPKRKARVPPPPRSHPSCVAAWLNLTSRPQSHSILTLGLGGFP